MQKADLNLGYKRYQSKYTQWELYHLFPQHGFSIALNRKRGPCNFPTAVSQRCNHSRVWPRCESPKITCDIVMRFCFPLINLWPPNTWVASPAETWQRCLITKESTLEVKAALSVVTTLFAKGVWWWSRGRRWERCKDFFQGKAKYENKGDVSEDQFSFAYVSSALERMEVGNETLWLSSYLRK